MYNVSIIYVIFLIVIVIILIINDFAVILYWNFLQVLEDEKNILHVMWS